MYEIKSDNLTDSTGRSIKTPQHLLEHIWHMVSMVCTSCSEFYGATNNKILLDTELVLECKKHLKYDLVEGMHLDFLVKAGCKYYNCSIDEVLLKSLKYADQEDCNINIIRSIPEAIEMLDVTTEAFIFPLRFFSPLIYKHLGNLFKTFDFERTKVKKQVAYKPIGEFSVEQTRKILIDLKGISLSEKFDFFPTPEVIINYVHSQANLKESDTILEPSAGTGSLIKGLINKITCVEINNVLAGILKGLGHDVHNKPFEDFESDTQFDKIIMNPPFSRRLDAKHIVKAFGNLKEGGILVAVHSMAINTASDKHSKAFQELYSNYGVTKKDFTGNEFAKSGKGTMIDTTVTTIIKMNGEYKNV